MVQLERENPRVAGPLPSPSMVSRGNVHATPQDVNFRDPSFFVAGELSNHRFSWEFVLSQNPKRDEILSYVVHGVKISEFFVPFRCDFQGKYYDSAIPPTAFFPNSKSCQGFEEFISATIIDRLTNGSLIVWGRVGEVHPPNLVMPITVEPLKASDVSRWTFFTPLD